MKNFFDYLIIVVDLASQPCFFVEAAVGLAICGVVDLAIGKTISMETDVAVSFFRLSLW